MDPKFKEWLGQVSTECRKLEVSFNSYTIDAGIAYRQGLTPYAAAQALMGHDRRGLQRLIDLSNKSEAQARRLSGRQRVFVAYVRPSSVVVSTNETTQDLGPEMAAMWDNPILTGWPDDALDIIGRSLGLPPKAFRGEEGFYSGADAAGRQWAGARRTAAPVAVRQPPDKPPGVALAVEDEGDPSEPVRRLLTLISDTAARAVKVLCRYERRS